MSFTLKLSKIAYLASLLCVLIVVVSTIIGYFTLNSLVILPISLLLAVGIYKKFSFPKEFHIDNKLLILLMVFFALLLSYEVTFANRNYLGAHEAIHTTMLRVLEINQKIPVTYEPFSDIAINYQFGFQLVAKIFAELFSLIRDYYVMWGLGIFFGMLEMAFVFVFVKIYFKSEKIALLSAALVPTSKIIFMSFFAGGYGRLMAEAFVFMFLALYVVKHPARYLLPPALLVIHPGYFLGGIIVSGVHSFVNKEVKYFLKSNVLVVLALPVVAVSLYPFFELGVLNLTDNLTELFSQSELALATPKSYLPIMWTALPGTYGALPILLFFVMAAYTIYKKELMKLPKNTKVIFYAGTLQLILGYFGMFYYSIAGEKFLNNFILLGMIFGVVQLHNHFLKKLDKKKFYAVVIIMLVIGLVAVFSSRHLQGVMQGRVIDKRTAEFGLEFYNYDKNLEKTFFATNYSGKLAEISNKIPFNPYEQTFVLSRTDFMARDEKFEKVKEIQEMKKSIIESKCSECIDELDVKYIIIDPEFANIKPEKNWEFLFEKNEIEAYKRA